jgi:Flp pilus assembly pilin Flp
MTAYRALIQLVLTSSYLALGAVGRRAVSAVEQRVPRFTSSSRGQTLVEYGLLIALIGIIVIVALLFLGLIVSQIFQNVGKGLQDIT